MEIRQLQYFVKVARIQHMTQAAGELHVAQSAVSRQIHLLEEELGAKLFVHRGRNLQLTPVGKLFLARAEEVLISLDKAINEVREFLDPEIGEVRFGFINSLGINMVPKVIKKFREEHPYVKFRFKQGVSSALINAVMQGEIDLALIAPLPEKIHHVAGELLLTEELYVVLPHDHLLAGAESVRLSQLKDEAFVLFNEGYSLRTIVWDACLTAGFVPKIGFEGEESDTIRGFVAAGMGVSLLPDSAMSDGSPLLTAKVRISEPKVSRTIGIITRTDDKLPLVAEVFRRFLLEFTDF